jgi:hypothetical protein
VKMHTLLDLRGNIPSFIHISDGKLHDMHALDMIVPDSGQQCHGTLLTVIALAATASPIWWSVRRRAVWASIRCHDVSGPGRQTLDLAMQSITTMIPCGRQCGNSRKDRPVRTS